MAQDWIFLDFEIINKYLIKMPSKISKSQSKSTNLSESGKTVDSPYEAVETGRSRQFGFEMQQIDRNQNNAILLISTYPFNNN